MSKPFSVNHWGSHPDAGNDDCYTGDDYDTFEQALAAYLESADYSVQYIEIDGLEDWELEAKGLTRVRKNPGYSRKECRRQDQWDRSEFAMQQGMAFGCDGYNEAMGYD